MCKKQCLSVSLLLVGVLVGLASLFCILFLPAFVTNQINQRLVLKNGSMILNRWSKPNVPMYFKVWLFDVTNAQQVIDGKGIKPVLKEIGPFVFHLRRSKDVISFAGDNLYFTEKRVYHFSPELSCCAINTTVTVPNIPLVAIVDKALSYNLPLVGRFIPRLINRAIQSLREQLFVRRQVRELLFDGYDVELLKMVSRVGSLVGMPQTNQKFAILKGRNDTWRPDQDGVWGINTGQRDRRLFGRVSSWNSYKQLPFWSAPNCNAINGSDGTLFAPPIKTSEPLYVFNPELCRTINLIYERPSEVRSIDALRYVLNPLNFARTIAGPEQPPPGPAAHSFDSAAVEPPSGVATAAQAAGTPTGAGSRAGVRSLDSRTGMAVGPPDPVGGLLLGAQRRLDNLQSVASSVVETVRAANHRMRHPNHHHTRHQPAVATGRNPTGPIGEPVMAGSELRPQIVRLSTPDDARPTQTASNRTGTEATRNTGTSASTSASATNSNTQTGGSSSSGGGGGGGEQVNNSGDSHAKRVAQAAQEAQDYKEHRDKLRLNPLLCFCDRKTTYLNGVNICEFDGLIDLSKCAKQTQVIFGSMPHFHLNDPRLLKQVHGLEPNATKHTTYLDIEPNTGLVLGGKRRFQLNIMIKHNLEVEGFENIADMMVPVVWIEESAMIPEESAKKFKSLYTDRIRLINIVLISLIFASATLILVDIRLMLFQSSGMSNIFRSMGILSTLASGSKQQFSVEKANRRQSSANNNISSGSPSSSSEFLSSNSSSNSSVGTSSSLSPSIESHIETLTVGESKRH